MVAACLPVAACLAPYPPVEVLLQSVPSERGTRRWRQLRQLWQLHVKRGTARGRSRACGRMAAAPGPPTPRTGPANPAGTACPGAGAGTPRPAALPLPGPACMQAVRASHSPRVSGDQP